MRTLIIAEAGVNHNGSIDTAKELINVAADAGADIVKFQTFKAENIVSKSARKADYQKHNMSADKDDSQYNMLKKLELSYDAHIELMQYCAEKNIRFQSTAFDLDSIDLLSELGMTIWKIPSGEITNLPYLRKIGKLNGHVILSTGMCTMNEIAAAVEVLVQQGTAKGNIKVLHCNTEYPTPMQDVNLLAMLTIKQTLGVGIGYSDHTLGTEVPVAAVALGAEIIEKHFTLDKSLEGPDHAASLDPAELKQMVLAIRNIEQAVSGSGEKEPSMSEMKNKIIVRKSIHLKHALPQDHVITEADLAMKRPGDGISPMEMDTVIGKKIRTDLPAEYKLAQTDLI